MKKVSITTIIDNGSIGTYLQIFATCKMIEELGLMPEVLHYHRPFKSTTSRLKSIIKGSGINFISMFYRILLLYRGKSVRDRSLNFVKKYVTPVLYRSFTEIKNNPPIADIYMTGSDQVWNSQHNKGLDKTFYLDWVPDGRKKIAYAASVGMDDFPQSEKNEIKRLLSAYDSISVREESARQILINMGISEEKVTTVLDPTFLLSKEDWAKYLLPKSPHDFKYLLIYSVEPNQQGLIEELASKIAKEKGLKIVSLYVTKVKPYSCSDVNHYMVTPEEFIYYFYHASFVIASSFHGTAFAINFEKEFVSVTPSRFNTRVQNILSLTGINDRLAVDSSYCLTSVSPIDYVTVGKKISEERERSRKYLASILS